MNKEINFKTNIISLEITKILKKINQHLSKFCNQIEIYQSNYQDKVSFKKFYRDHWNKIIMQTI